MVLVAHVVHPHLLELRRSGLLRPHVDGLLLVVLVSHVVHPHLLKLGSCGLALGTHVDGLLLMVLLKIKGDFTASGDHWNVDQSATCQQRGHFMPHGI